MYLQVCSGLRARQTKITPLSVVTSRSLCGDFSAENVYYHPGPRRGCRCWAKFSSDFQQCASRTALTHSRVSWDWEAQSENWPLGFSFPSTCNQIFRSLHNWQGKSRLLEDLSEQANLLSYTYFYFHMDTEVQVITFGSNSCCIHENKSENACVQIDIELKKPKCACWKDYQQP